MFQEISVALIMLFGESWNAARNIDETRQRILSRKRIDSNHRLIAKRFTDNYVQSLAIIQNYARRAKTSRRFNSPDVISFNKKEEEEEEQTKQKLMTKINQLRDLVSTRIQRTNEIDTKRKCLLAILLLAFMSS